MLQSKDPSCRSKYSSILDQGLKFPHDFCIKENKNLVRSNLKAKVEEKPEEAKPAESAAPELTAGVTIKEAAKVEEDKEKTPTPQPAVRFAFHERKYYFFLNFGEHKSFS